MYLGMLSLGYTYAFPMVNGEKKSLTTEVVHKGLVHISYLGHCTASTISHEAFEEPSKTELDDSFPPFFFSKSVLQWLPTR